MNKEQIKRTERGWAGHFICGPRCRFHLNTLLEYNKTRIIVSTVGMMFTDDKPDQIGCDRYYETMAFEAETRRNGFVEINVKKEIDFSSKWCIEEPYKDNEANEMHENAVQEIINKLTKDDK